MENSRFFLKKETKESRKRKVGQKPTTAKGAQSGHHKKNKHNANNLQPKAKKQRAQKSDEEIASDDEDNESYVEGKTTNLVFSSDEGEEETPQDKRLRLAKQYLTEIEKQEAERAEDRALEQHIEQRLHTEYLDSVGKLRRNIASNIKSYDAEHVVTLKHKVHHAPLCALALSTDGKYLFTGAKTQFLLKWDTESKKVLGKCDVLAHREENTTTDKKRRSHIIAICLTSDMKYLALAEGGNNIQIWCPNTLQHLKTFKGHRDVVTALVFRKGTHDLYSGAKDRSVKIWSLDEMAYVESLFGHQAGITSIDALSRERALSAGGSDCSLRIWKITEESQLIYNGHFDSIEQVRFLNDENFVAGGVDGAVTLWSALKKKPLSIQKLAHGQADNGVANWITAIATVVNTDLVATGSCDGYIRLWQTVPNARKLLQILIIPVTGFINGLAFNSDGSKLFAAVGQEHRMGRWWRIADAKNRILIFNIIQGLT